MAWASTQLNLANALQYLPSVHQEANLDEAVQLYEEVLQYRDPQRDPLGYARILANQGNALGHLGVLRRRPERLTRARELFAPAATTRPSKASTRCSPSLDDAAARREGA